MKGEQRTRSIARRINRSWLWRMLMTFLILDIAVLVLAAGGWFYMLEMSQPQPVADRDIVWDEQTDWWNRPLTVSYRMVLEDGEQVTVAGRGFFFALRTAFAGLIGFETLILLIQYGAGKRRARRLLQPLENISRSARALSEAARLDPEKLHQLESAIAGVSPLTPEARLRTGDKELQGLEKAINDLLARMHESYREQSRFVSDASHELRTPIAGIQGYADMLQRWGRTDEKVLDEGIDAIRTETAHMKTLVEQLLFLARGDNGRTRLTMEDMDLRWDQR